MTPAPRTLTITLQPDWRAALRAVGQRAQATIYQGETLNFDSPEAFFGRLTQLRWALVRALQGQGVLAELGLVERDEGGGVLCPFAEVHIDMHMLAPQPLAA